MSIDEAHFRNVMGHFATGVTLVTGADRQGRPVGLTANALTSVSLDPPFLLVCVDRDSASLPVFLDTERFGVSILRAGQESLARRFSREDPEERFTDLEVRTGETGVPIVTGVLGWAECRLWKSVEAGDHYILVGRVEECGVDDDGPPLVFFQGSFGTVSS